MTDIVPAIDLVEMRRHIERLHRHAEAYGAGSLKLMSSGLDPQQPRPLPLIEQSFPIGGVDPMAEAAMRLNREAGRNVTVAPNIYDDAGAVVAVFGFALKIAPRLPGWLAQLPLAPSAALAAADTAWAIFLLSEPTRPETMLTAAQAIAEFARVDLRPGAGDQALLAGPPLLGGIYTATSSVAAPVKLELPWRSGYRLDQLVVGLEPDGGPARITFAAVRPQHGGGTSPSGGSGSGGSGGIGGDDNDDDDNERNAEFGRMGLSIRAKHRKVEIGSDVEIGQIFGCELVYALGQVVSAEGDLWHYLPPEGRWRMLEADIVKRLAFAFDGAVYTKPNGRDDAVQLSKSRVGSILDCLSALLGAPGFFDDEPVIGVNCRNGFVAIDPSGNVELRPHDPKYRCRHMIDADWDRWLAEAAEDPPRSSLLSKLLWGCFGEDADFEDKCKFVAETAGAAATGCITRLPRPRAVIWYGPRAQNGKSAWFDLFRGLLPAGAVSAIPANELRDPRYLVQLRGKLANLCDELTASSVVGSDHFKKVITGEPLMARDVYRSAVQFRNRALHGFSTNVLPSFTGGFDPGVQSRLSLLEFTRAIPKQEQIPGLGRRVAAEEPQLALAFAVAGAQRLLRQRDFTVPASSAVGLRRWFMSADPVAAWARARLRPYDAAALLPGGRDLGIATATLLRDFNDWQKDAGYKANMQVASFSRRLQALVPYLQPRHTKAGNFLKGGVLGEPADANDDDDELTS